MWTPDYTGMWSTSDGSVRKLLLPKGRYLVLIAHGAMRLQGNYRIEGNTVRFRSDDGRLGQSSIAVGKMSHGETVLVPEGLDEVAA